MTPDGYGSTHLSTRTRYRGVWSVLILKYLGPDSCDTWWLWQDSPVHQDKIQRGVVSAQSAVPRSWQLWCLIAIVSTHLIHQDKIQRGVVRAQSAVPRSWQLWHLMVMAVLTSSTRTRYRGVWSVLSLQYLGPDSCDTWWLWQYSPHPPGQDAEGCGPCSVWSS